MSKKTLLRNRMCISAILLICLHLTSLQLFAQTDLCQPQPEKIIIESFDWFTGKNWKELTDLLNRNLLNTNFSDRKSNPSEELQGVVQKIFNNQPDGFIYEITIRNNSAEKIVAVTWEHVFINSLTGEVIGKHIFTVNGEIRSGKRKSLFTFTNLPPTNVISVELLERNPKKPFLESVAIKSVKYK